MAQRAEITLTDAATTPVNHVYKPVGSAGPDILAWQDRTQSVLLGQNRLTVYQRPADRKSQATKVTWKLETPILAQASGGTSSGYIAEPKVSHTLIAKGEFVLPAKSVLQERKDLLAQVRDLLGETIVTNQVHDVDLIF
jgi:hypothetical protein